MWDDVYNKSALIVVDPQQGFSDLCPNELPVPGATNIVNILNRLLVMPWKVIYATQDWHPATHSSFSVNGGIYNMHCVKNTRGAEFFPGLWQEYFHAIFRKGFKQYQDAYSANLDHPGFCRSLKKQVEYIYVAGMCTNICVFETACDFLLCGGYKGVHIIDDASAELPLPEDHAYNPISIRNRCELLDIKFVKSADILPII